MKKIQKALKVLAIAAVFSLAFLGVQYSSSTEKLAGEDVTVQSLSLVSTAKADNCEASPFPQPGYGNCNYFGRCSFLDGYGTCTP